MRAPYIGKLPTIKLIPDDDWDRGYVPEAQIEDDLLLPRDAPDGETPFVIRKMVAAIHDIGLTPDGVHVTSGELFNRRGFEGPYRPADPVIGPPLPERVRLVDRFSKPIAIPGVKPRKRRAAVSTQRVVSAIPSDGYLSPGDWALYGDYVALQAVRKVAFSAAAQSRSFGVDAYFGSDQHKRHLQEEGALSKPLSPYTKGETERILSVCRELSAENARRDIERLARPADTRKMRPFTGGCKEIKDE